MLNKYTNRLSFAWWKIRVICVVPFWLMCEPSQGSSVICTSKYYKFLCKMSVQEYLSTELRQATDTLVRKLKPVLWKYNKNLKIVQCLQRILQNVTYTQGELDAIMHNLFACILLKLYFCFCVSNMCVCVGKWSNRNQNKNKN